MSNEKATKAQKKIKRKKKNLNLINTSKNGVLCQANLTRPMSCLIKDLATPSVVFTLLIHNVCEQITNAKDSCSLNNKTKPTLFSFFLSQSFQIE